MPTMRPTMRPTATAPAARTVPCPACQGPSLYHADNPWRPFCSQRCKHMDLGAWAREDFRVPTENTDPQAAAQIQD